MSDIIFQKKFDQAWEFKKQGKLSDAMSLYSELYEQLMRDAFTSMGGSIGLAIDDKLKVEEYLRGDNLSCTILNNMATILAENGDIKSAKKYFKESINVIPDGLDYKDPIIGLRELEK